MGKGEMSYLEMREQMVRDVLLKPNEYYNAFVGGKIHRNHVKNLCTSPKGIVYNSTMNKDNIIQFPYGEIRNPIMDPNPNDKMDIAGECIQEILMTLSEYGYTAKDDKTIL